MAGNFGETLRKLRQEAGKSMGDLARHLEVSVTYVSDVERGNRGPFTKERILATADFLGIDAELLLVPAAASRGTFELEAEAVSKKAKDVGAALMRGWTDLDDGDLQKIADILEKKKR